jgi:hypothetical protein
VLKVGRTTVDLVVICWPEREIFNYLTSLKRFSIEAWIEGCEEKVSTSVEFTRLFNIQ